MSKRKQKIEKSAPKSQGKGYLIGWYAVGIFKETGKQNPKLAREMADERISM